MFFLHTSSCARGRQCIWVIYTWARINGSCAHLALCFLSNVFVFSRPATVYKYSSSLTCIPLQLLNFCGCHRCRKTYHWFLFLVIWEHLHGLGSTTGFLCKLGSLCIAYLFWSWLWFSLFITYGGLDIKMLSHLLCFFRVAYITIKSITDVLCCMNSITLL